MKSIIFIAALFILGITIFDSCTYDAAYPEICFSSQILPIYVSNCSTTGCHDGSSDSEENNIVLTDYAHIMDGITANHPSQSEYYTVLTGSGEERMPPSKPLTSGQVSLIKAWIDQGAQETNCSGNSSCDTSNITYSGNIAGILSSNCIGCHKAGSTSGGVNIDGYSNLKAYLDAAKTNFLNTINYNSTIKMPPTYKLSDCNLAQLNQWIQAGYPNN